MNTDMDLEKQIQDLEREEERLIQKKLKLEEKKKLFGELDHKTEKFFHESKFVCPKELAEALIEKYSLKINANKSETRRKRTTISANLRDTIKSYVNSGESMHAISKQMELSYAVVVKIMNGDYDDLDRNKGSLIS